LIKVIIGRPLKLQDLKSEEIGSIEGIAALSLDAITSVAYGPEAIIVVLATAGATALHLVLPITIFIVVLLTLLVMSYRQVIDGYPGGGGAYIVSKTNLGKKVSQVAAASLIVDYTLTVAVSIAAGVGALTSAFTGLAPLTVLLCLIILAVITVLNLRGVGEAARAFLLPTIIFIFGILTVIAVGLIHPLANDLIPHGKSLLNTNLTTSLSILLILKAFASGCSALTGVEAIANGVPLFKEPRVKNAKNTELLLGIILGVMLIGLAILANKFHISPRTDNTVLSQIMLKSIGLNWAYYLISFAVLIELALAANTSFGGLPILTSLLSKDNYLPHFFGLRSDRLVYSRGVWVLTGLSGTILIALNGNTDNMIPLFAIGVFTGFTLAQTGMVVHWLKLKPANWHYKALLNGLGALLTAIATIVFVVTKFTEGAWIVVVTIPIFILMFNRINSYYKTARNAIELSSERFVKTQFETLVLVPVVDISKTTELALTNAFVISDRVVALKVVFPEDNTFKDFETRWRTWNNKVRLITLNTEYHSVVHPLVRFIELISNEHLKIIVIIPVYSPPKWYQKLLHNQLDLVLSSSLSHLPNVIVAKSLFSQRSVNQEV
jgi:amino acid transporter